MCVYIESAFRRAIRFREAAPERAEFVFRAIVCRVAATTVRSAAVYAVAATPMSSTGEGRRRAHQLPALPRRAPPLDAGYETPRGCLRHDLCAERAALYSRGSCAIMPSARSLL